jgi:hypothetical protein
MSVCQGDGKTCHEKLQQAAPSPGAIAAASASASIGPEYTFHWRTGFARVTPANGKPSRRLA